MLGRWPCPLRRPSGRRPLAILLPLLVLVLLVLLLGQSTEGDAAPLCHWSGFGYERIEVASADVAGHQCHGDIAPGGVYHCLGFGDDCTLQEVSKCTSRVWAPCERTG